MGEWRTMHRHQSKIGSVWSGFADNSSQGARPEPCTTSPLARRPHYHLVPRTAIWQQIRLPSLWNFQSVHFCTVQRHVWGVTWKPWTQSGKTSGEWTEQKNMFEETHKYFHTQSAAQCDQLDQRGATTPIVAVLYSRWEENLSGVENRQWKGRKKNIPQLPAEGRRASRASCIAPATAAYTGLQLPHGSAGCMRLTAEESRCTVTTDNGADSLYGIKRDGGERKKPCTATHRTENQVLFSMSTQVGLKLQCHCSLY